jgi:hypothetical protein
MTPAQRARLRQGASLLLLAAAGAAFVAFALPASLWLGNRTEFTAPWAALLAPYALPALLVALACGVVGAAANAREYSVARALLAALVLMLWVQGTLLVWEYGLFDGRSIDWSQGRWRGWVDAAFWIAALVAAARWHERAGRVLARVAVVLCLVQVAMAGASLATARATVAPPADALAAQQALSGFSRERNVLHVIADGFQTDIFAELLAEPGPKPLAGELEGFVFYRDNLGAFPYTHLAVPALVGGLVYANDEPLQPFVARALGPRSILGAARAAGFEVEIGVPAGGVASIYAHAAGRLLPIPVELHKGAWRSQRDESLLLADLALFRVVPHFAKAIVHNDQRWFFQYHYGRRSVAGTSFLVHNAFLRAMADGLDAGRPRPTYKLVHLMLSHRPWVANPDCSHAGAPRSGREAVKDHARCSLRSLLGLVEAMKREGVYDATTIVITGDHGSFVDATALRGTMGLGPLAPGAIGQARPLLLVKPPRARGPLRVSDAPTWVVDVGATIADAASIPGEFPGTSALRLDPAAPRERRFHEYNYARNEWSEDYVEDIREYVVRGRTDDYASWRAGRVLEKPDAATPR